LIYETNTTYTNAVKSRLAGIADIRVSEAINIGIGAAALSSLTDVGLTSPAANDILVYDGSSWTDANSLTLGNVRIGVTASGEIDTSSGNLTIDSTGGTTTVDDNLTVTGALRATGSVSESSLGLDRIDIGVASGTPRIVFENSGYTNWMIDNDLGTFRWFQPGVTKMLLSSTELTLGAGVSLVFEGSTDNAFETILTVTDPTADRTITLPNVTGTVITTGDTGTVTNTMLAGSIADTKLSTISTALKVSNSATTATSSNTASAIVARDASGNFTAGTITAALTGNASTSTKASTLAQNGGSGTGMTFYWSGQGGQPNWLWGGNDGTNHYVYNPSNFSVSSAGSSNATTFTGTYVRMAGNGDADPHSEQGLQSGVGGTGAGVAMWASGVAPQFRVGSGNNTVYLRNSNDSAYATLEGVITNVSSVHLKQDIEEFPKIAKSVGAAVNELEFDTGLDIVRRLRPVTYRWKEDEHFYQLPENPRRALALARLNKLRKENGLEPYESDELRHDCGRDNCSGTAENPCTWTKNWDIGNLGFISQEVGEVIPQAAIIGKDNEFTSLDSIAMVAVAVAAIKEMDATITLLRQRIETLENK
jgi:hypothetical protein